MANLSVCIWRPQGRCMDAPTWTLGEQLCVKWKLHGLHIHASQMGHNTCFKSPSQSVNSGLSTQSFLDWLGEMIPIAMDHRMMLTAIAVAQKIPASSYACLIVQAWTAGCNLRLVKALAQGLPILYNHVVKEVKYEQAGVSITAGDAVIRGNPSGLSLCKAGCTAFYCSTRKPEQSLASLHWEGLNGSPFLFAFPLSRPTRHSAHDCCSRFATCVKASVTHAAVLLAAVIPVDTAPLYEHSLECCVQW